MSEMGFTTLITMYPPVGMNNTHQCITSYMLLIMDVKKLD